MKTMFCMTLKFLPVALFIFFAPVVLSAQAPPVIPRVINLEECLRLSLKNSPRLKTEELESIRLLHHQKATAGTGLPQVSFSGSYDDYLNLPTQMIPNIFSNPPAPEQMIPVQFGTTFNIAGGVDVTQVIYNQSWLTALKMARQQLQLHDLEREKTTIEVIFDVAQSYYLTQITLQQIRNMTSNLGKLEKAEKIAGSQFQHGLIMRTDLDRIVVQKINLTTELERLEVVLQQQLAFQKYYMGLDQQENISVSDSIGLAPAVISQGNPADHIDIRMLGQSRELAGTAVKMEQAGWYPSLTFIATTNYMNQSNTMYLFGKPTDWFNTSLARIQFNVPLFSGLQRHNKVSQSKIELEKLKVAEQDTRQLLQLNSDDAARKLLNSISAEKKQRENVKLAERVFATSQEQYEKGVIPLTDLLNAETALSDAQGNHTYALIQMKLSELNYLRANGLIMTHFNF